MNGTPKLVGFGLVALLAGSALAGCGTTASAKSGNLTMQTLEPVDPALAAKAQTSCWFKVKNRTSKGDEVRLWNASASNGAKAGRLGELIIVTGAMDPPVRDNHYYGCALYEYNAGSPVALTATAATLPVRFDSVIPYGFARDGHKEIK